MHAPGSMRPVTLQACACPFIRCRHRIDAIDANDLLKSRRVRDGRLGWVDRAGVWAGLVLGLGLLFSWLLAQRQAEETRLAAHQRLEQASARAVKLLGALGKPVYGLAGTRGVQSAVGARLSAAAFRRYIAARDLPREFPGVMGSA